MSTDLQPSAFEDAIGADAVVASTPADMIDGVAPRLVVHPRSSTEVSTVLKIAHEHGLTVVPRGLGRHLGLGNPPRRVDVVVSLEHMNRVLSYEPADMTVRAEAGCPLVALGAALFEGRQWLPLDPPHTPSTTVGGALATNLSGPLRASQGTARDLLIGIRTVGADGVLVSGGGKVVKNVAGYDLPKMHVGALGTLGIIVDATFKVRPRPQSEEALEVACTSAEHAAALALELRDAWPPFWVQIANDAGPPDSWRIVAGAGGCREDVRAAIETYRDIAARNNALSRPVAGATEVRHQLANASAHPGNVVLRLATLPTDVGTWMHTVETQAARIGTSPRFHADPVSGVVRAGFHPDATQHLGEILEAARPELERNGGSLVLERATPSQKQLLAEYGDVWGDPGPGLPLMRGLKEAFDPAATLAPGRYVGGL